MVERVHFIEYGLIALLFYRIWKSAGDSSTVILPALAGLLVATLEEWFQWFIPNRVGEARDVLLNLAAIACGLLFSVGADPPARLRLRPAGPGAQQRIALGAAVVGLVFATFVATVHVGYPIHDPTAGTFRSRYPRERLVALSQDRAARWRTDPPLTLRRISREDQYLDEGLWHVRRRNEAWADGDYAKAWHENLILEGYFAPVLDTSTYAGRSGHRWPADQRADAQRAEERHTDAAHGPLQAVPYVSDAEPYPLLTVSKRSYWLGVAVIVAALLAISLM